MDPLIIFVILLSFFATYISVQIWIKRAKEHRLVGRDLHKLGKEEVAEGGGLTFLFGLTMSVLFYIGFRVFYLKDGLEIVYIFGLLLVLFISSFVGIIDDLMGWKRGLSKRVRLLIVLFAAVPLMVINAGESSVLGMELGIFYPLIVIPLGVVGATTTYNFLAGYNGLEASQGIIILSALTYVTYITGNSWLSVISLCAVASLFAFYIFNKYPARVFPGDILTYTVGALIAVIAILGNIEKIALFFFIPYIMEVGLKSRGKLKKESFAKLNSDGSLDMPYEKIYGLEHLAIYILKKVKKSGKVYEPEVVYLINVFQILIIGIGILLFL